MLTAHYVLSIAWAIWLMHASYETIEGCNSCEVVCVPSNIQLTKHPLTALCLFLLRAALSQIALQRPDNTCPECA